MIHPRLSFFPSNKFLIRLLVKKSTYLSKGFLQTIPISLKKRDFIFFFYKAADNLRIPDLTELYFIFPR